MRFTIEAVSKMTGIPAASLRNWEKRYGFPKPKRSASGHRYFCAEDVEFLKRALRAINEGESLSSIAELYQKERLQDGACSSEKSPPLRDVVDDVSYRVELIYDALMRFDETSILQHFTLLNAKLSPEQMFDRVFEALLRRLGRAWAEGKVSVAQEHYASAFVRNRLVSFFVLNFPPTRQEKVLLTTSSGERHEGGLMLIAAHLKFRGYPISYVGADVPVEDIRALVSSLQPKVLCLSYSDPENLRRDLPLLGGLSTQVCLGGMALFDSEAMASMESLLGPNIHLCNRTIGSAAADFVEMVCQCHASWKE